MAHRHETHVHGDVAYFSVPGEGRGPSLEEIAPGAVHRGDVKRRLPFLEAQGLGVQGHRGAHGGTRLAPGRKVLVHHHLFLAALGQGDLDLFQTALGVAGLQHET